MALLPLYFDVTRRILVNGITDSTPFSIGTLYQEDTPSIELHAVKRVNYLVSPAYSQLSLAGYSLTVSLGTAATPIASQTSWTLSADSYSLTGDLALNTSGVNALSDGGTTIFEVRFGQPGYYTTQQVVAVKKAISLAGAVADPPGDTALGLDQATGLFLPKNDARAFTLLSQDGTQRMLLYVHNDGSFRTELIT